MKILQVSTGYVKIPPEIGGGIELYIYEISKLLSLGHDITILDRNFNKEESQFVKTEYIDDLKIDRLNTKIIDFRKIKINFFNILFNEFIFSLGIHKYIKDKNFDIIHIHIPIIAFILVMLDRDLRNKMVYTSHMNSFSSDNKKLTISKKIYQKISLLMMKKVEKVISPNNELKNTFMKNGIDNNKIFVINHGVNVDIFNSEIDNYRTEIMDTKRRYEIYNDKIIILFVGRIAEEKGVEYLIKAAKILQDGQYDNISFLLVGPVNHFGINELKEDKYAAKILSLIKEYKLEQYIKLVGKIPVKDLIIIYKISEIVVVPSLYESFGLVATEGMASGKPVIGTKIDGLSLQIKNKHNGFLIEPANEFILAEKIKYLIDNPLERVRMGINGRKLAVEKFDWRNVVEKLLDIYNNNDEYKK